MVVPGENILGLLDIVGQLHNGVLQFDEDLLESFVLFVDVAFLFHFLKSTKNYQLKLVEEMFFLQVDLELDFQALLACPIEVIPQECILGLIAKY